MFAVYVVLCLSATFRFKPDEIDVSTMILPDLLRWILLIMLVLNSVYDVIGCIYFKLQEAIGSNNRVVLKYVSSLHLEVWISSYHCVTAIATLTFVPLFCNLVRISQ